MREKLAALAHERWIGWMSYMLAKCVKNSDGSITIPAPLVQRWTRQMNTPYAELPEGEKESDRVEADLILALIQGEG